MLAYFSNFFNKLNETNLNLQRKETSPMIRLMLSLESWTFGSNVFKKMIFHVFLNLNEFLYENESSVTPIIAEKIKEHLINLKSGLNSYFLRIREESDNLWVQNLF